MEGIHPAVVTFVVALAAALPAAGCGASNQPANDQTTVTVEKPSDSSTPPPPPAPPPSAGPTSGH